MNTDWEWDWIFLDIMLRGLQLDQRQKYVQLFFCRFFPFILPCDSYAAFVHIVVYAMACYPSVRCRCSVEITEVIELLFGRKATCGILVCPQIRTGLLLFWWTLTRGESRRWPYFQDELYRNHSRAVGIGRRGLVGIWNWGRRHSIRLYGGICVLQACWRTC